jgi:DNA-binding FadR family transcriptional regulator
MIHASERIVRRKLADEVFDRLKALITGGELQPGDSLPSERELMQRFGVGRLPIREAMQSLASLGLITISHGERARVRELTARSLMKQVETAAQIMLSSSPASLEHLKAARRFFETEMAREAARRATPGDIAALQGLLDAQRASLGDADVFMSADMRFHNRLAAMSGNPIFEAVSEAMLSWLRRYHTEMLIWSGKEKFTLAEHERIIGHVAAHEPEAAAEAMAAHLDRSAALYAHS